MRQIFWANLYGSGWAACHQTGQAQHQTPTLACCSCPTNSEMGMSGSTIQGHWFLRLVKFIFFFVGPLGGTLWISLWGSHLTEFFNFLGTDSAHRDLPKNKFFEILSALFPGAKFFDNFFPKSPDIKILLVQINELGPSLYVKRVFMRFRYMSHLP